MVRDASCQLILSRRGSGSFVGADVPSEPAHRLLRGTKRLDGVSGECLACQKFTITWSTGEQTMIVTRLSGHEPAGTLRAP